MQDNQINNFNESLKDIEATFDSDGNIKTKNKSNSLFPKILSVIAAFALWLYVFQAVEYETEIRDIPIALENFNTNLGFDIVNGFENTVDITLSGTKSSINSIGSKDIRAFVDMSSVTEKGQHILNVVVDVPSSAKIVEQSVAQIKILVDKTVKKQVEITPSISYNIQYPYQMGEPIFSSDAVTVKGPETDINSISRAEVVLDIGNVKNDTKAKASVKLYDANNYEIKSEFIMISPSEIDITIPVTKTAFLPVIPNLSVDTDKFQYSFEPSSVYLKGNVNQINAFSYVNTKHFDIKKEGRYELEFDLPEHVSAYSSYDADESFMIKGVTLFVEKKKSVIEIPDILINIPSSNGDEHAE